MCLCAIIPKVNNRTGIIMLQHPRERFHPLGTARIAALGLSKFSLHVAFRSGESRRVHHPIDLPEGTGLLYPHPDAEDLAQVAPSQRPRHLVVLDGTWSHAHRLYQDNSWLHRLPHYRLSPARPSRYRIRREPKPHCMSTIESIGLALRCLEPELQGVEALVEVLDSMVDAQLASRAAGSRTIRRKRPRQRRLRRVPLSLLDTPERIVLVYGETAPLGSRRDPHVSELMQWSAVRLVDGRSFDGFVRSSRDQPAPSHLTQLGLVTSDLAAADTIDGLARSFSDFVRPDDVLAAWNQSTLSQLALLGRNADDAISLKAAYCNLRGGKCGTLEHVMATEALGCRPVSVSGRAAGRLGNVLAIAHHLRALSAM